MTSVLNPTMRTSSNCPQAWSRGEPRKPPGIEAGSHTTYRNKKPQPPPRRALAHKPTTRIIYKRRAPK